VTKLWASAHEGTQRPRASGGSLQRSRARGPVERGHAAHPCCGWVSCRGGITAWWIRSGLGIAVNKQGPCPSAAGASAGQRGNVNPDVWRAGRAGSCWETQALVPGGYGSHPPYPPTRSEQPSLWRLLDCPCDGCVDQGNETCPRAGRGAHAVL